jgi:hypothetical protein
LLLLRTWTQRSPTSAHCSASESTGRQPRLAAAAAAAAVSARRLSCGQHLQLFSSCSSQRLQCCSAAGVTPAVGSCWHATDHPSSGSVAGKAQGVMA